MNKEPINAIDVIKNKEKALTLIFEITTVQNVMY